MEMEEVREKLPYPIPPRLFRAIVEELDAAKTVVRDANLLRLPDHKITLRDEEQGLVDRVRSLVAATPLAPPELKQIEREIAIPHSKLVEVIKLLERDRSIVRVSAELYFTREVVQQLKNALVKHLSETDEVTPAVFRDLFGTSRKYTIPLLEYFDREGVTYRVGDVRRLKMRSAEAR
jgi:selenocysteine-specific elongation factor